MAEINKEINTAFLSIRDQPYCIPTNIHTSQVGCRVKSLQLFQKLLNLELNVVIGIVF